VSIRSAALQPCQGQRRVKHDLAVITLKGTETSTEAAAIASFKLPETVLNSMH